MGSTAIGLKTAKGVILAVEKRVGLVLMEPATTEKIVEIDSHIGCASSGLMADSRTMVDRARVECQVSTCFYPQSCWIHYSYYFICFYF